MIVHKILIYCDMANCLSTIVVEPTPERTLSETQAINTAHEAGWKIKGKHPNRRAVCPNHRYGATPLE